jgi:hypothetical protein
MVFQVKKWVWKIRWWRNAFHGPQTLLHDLPLQNGPQIELSLSPAEEAALLGEADDALSHKWGFFQLNKQKEEEINWHLDPFSSMQSPKTFSFDINFRNERAVGNYKIIWEKSRHHHLTILASAYACSKNEAYAEEIAAQILHWIKENPYLTGINWISPLENGIRLISWVWCERLLRNSTYYDRIFGTTSPFWESVFFHQLFIADSYSRGSSANNHLIGEMAGLFIAAKAWPLYKQSKTWQKLAKRILETEIPRQTFPSGINRELAFSYHLFVAEFCLLAAVEAEKSDDPFSKTYLDLLKRMIEVIPLLTDAGGNLPNYGDGDDGMAIQFQPYQGNRSHWLLQAGHSLVKADVLTPKNNCLTAQILGCSKTNEPGFTVDRYESSSLPDAGLYILTRERNKPHELFVLADAGPHGFLSLSAHGHADALSFTLSVGGKQIFVDPGTYAYHTEEAWRNYFRSTRAHNTLQIDKKEQSQPAGPFLWKKTARVTVHRWATEKDGAVLTASHDGYKEFGVTHKRNIALLGTRLTIRDEIDGEGEHTMDLLFHTNPQCRVQKKEDNVLQIERGSALVKVTLAEDLSVGFEHGGSELGWYSSKFGVKVPCITIIGTAFVSLPCTFITTMEVTFEG